MLASTRFTHISVCKSHPATASAQSKKGLHRKSRNVAAQVRRAPLHAKPGFQLDLLPSELLGNVQFRSLQSLPHYGRDQYDVKLAARAAERLAMWQHNGCKFLPAGTVPTGTHLAMASTLQSGHQHSAISSEQSAQSRSAPTLRCSEPWQGASKGVLAPGSAGGDSMRPLNTSWYPQQVLGSTLPEGDGV